MSRDNVSRKSN